MKLRYLLAAISAGLFAALATLFASDRLLFATLSSGVAMTSDYRLKLDAAELSWFPLRFSAGLILVTPDRPESAPLFALQGVELTGTLGNWLRGIDRGSVAVDNLSLFIDETAPQGRPDGTTVLHPLALFPSVLTVDTMHLIDRREDVWIFPLRALRGERRDDGSLAVSAQAGTSEQPLQVETVITPRLATGAVEGLDVAAAVLDSGRRNALTLYGALDAEADNLRYEFLLKGAYAQVHDFFRAFDADAYALDGRLEVTGTLRGDLDTLALAVELLRVDNTPDYRFDAAGNIAQATAASPQLDLQLNAVVGGDAHLPLLPRQLQDLLDGADLSLNVSGTLDAPVVDRAALTARSDTGLRLSVSAEGLRADPGDIESTIASAPLKLRLEGDDSQSLAELLQRPIPAFDAWHVQGTLSGSAARYRVDELQGRLAFGGSSEILLGGHIATIAPADDGITAAISGMALTAQLSGDGAGAALLSVLIPGSDWPVPRSGTINLSGEIADAATLRGVDVPVNIQNMRFAAAAADNWPPDLVELGGSARVRRAAERWQIDAISVSGSLADGSAVTVAGDAQLGDAGPEADLRAELVAPAAGALPWPGPIRLHSPGASAQLRLRERWATLLGEIQTARQPVQLVASADMAAGAPTALRLDVYTPVLDLASLQLQSPNESPELIPDSAPTLLKEIPTHITVRADDVQGSRTRLDSLSVEVEGDEGRYLLRHLDAAYAGGYLVLRGAMDFSGTVPVYSLAGEGAQVPLGDLTRDLGLQESISGMLAMRGGVTAQGNDRAAVLSSLQGRIAVAGSAITVSGPAYDLLMSNFLAWLATGADESTTRFNCAMAQFDISSGIARSDSLYLESPRMLATGKAKLDLPSLKVDARLEPRSRMRTLQFPSAVRFLGAVDDPKVSVSALQATGDAAAQALLLLPSLTLKLFGIRAEDTDRRGPCIASLE